MGSVFSDRGRLRIQFHYKGSWCREFVGRDDNRDNRRASRNLLKRIEIEILTGTFEYLSYFPNSRTAARLGLRVAKALKPPPTLGEFAKSWLEELQVSPETRYDYASLLRTHLDRYPVANKRIDEVDDGDINRLVAVILGKGKAHAPRVNKLILRLRSIFAAAGRRRGLDGERLLRENPMFFVRNLREPRTHVDPFDDSDVRKILSEATGWQRRLLAVLIGKGLRPNE